MRATTLLTVREIPRRAQISMFTMKQDLSPGRVLMALCICALVLTPTVLYLTERGRLQDQRRVYANLIVESTTEHAFLKSSISDLLSEQSRLTELLLAEGHTVRAGAEVTVKVIATGYSSSIYQTDATPWTTAWNTTTRHGVLAMSRDLLRRYTPDAPFTFGDRVHIAGVGDFIVEDSMNARWDNRVDVWFPSKVEALRFGIREVYLTATVEEEEPRTPAAGL